MMENTLLIGLSRQVALKREMDVIANNMANVNTSGFKADEVVFNEIKMPVARADAFPGADRKLSYTYDRMSWINLGEGEFQQTNNRLDVAIQGDGYFAVETPQGERYTRNGAFQINAVGELVTNEGMPVIGEGGKIVFDPQVKEIMISRDGTISTENGPFNRLRVVNFADARGLKKEGSSLFAAATGQSAEIVSSPTVQQGTLERSNVKPVLTMSRMIEVTRAYQSLANMMDRHQDVRRTGIERLAEVPN